VLPLSLLPHLHLTPILVPQVVSDQLLQLWLRLVLQRQLPQVYNQQVLDQRHSLLARLHRRILLEPNSCNVWIICTLVRFLHLRLCMSIGALATLMVLMEKYMNNNRSLPFVAKRPNPKSISVGPDKNPDLGFRP